MRTIPAFCVLVTMLLAFPLSAAADNSAGPEGNVFSLRPLSGFLWGKGVEIVYQGFPALNSAPHKSRLDWDLKPLVFAGILLEYAPPFPALGNGVYASLALSFGLPLETGSVENRDWLAPGEDFLTNYSRHKAYSRSAPEDFLSGYGTLDARLSAGYSWAAPKSAWIRPYAELSWRRFSWESFDGYLQYGPNNPNGTVFIPWNPAFPREPTPGPAIHYSQNWIIVSPALAAGITITDCFALSFSLALTPLVYGICRDDHLARNTTFIDTLYGGLYYRFGGEARFILNKIVSVSASTAFTDLTGSRGDTQKISNNTSVEYKGSAGGGFTFGEFSLLVNVNL